MTSYRAPRASVIPLVLVAAMLVHCSSSSSPAAMGDAGGDALAMCYPDNDGVNNLAATVDLTVDDTGFSKMVISTQNDSPVVFTLTNKGTKPHGFSVGCTTTTAPAGCPTKVCFPDTSTIEPLAPGTSKEITFETPTPDGVLYPFKSNGPDDAKVPGLNEGQWSLM
jgi:hypothetical protein